MGTVAIPETKTMLTLPGDAVRQILWRFSDRFDLQMLVQSARGVARGTVARMVAAGERNTHEWTPAKDEMLDAFDRAGGTAAVMEPEEGGFIVGPKNLALGLAAFELAWVDGGAATASLAGFLALSPIHERGTPEQVTRYKTLSSPPQPGEDRKPWRGAFALTEPIPNVGVDAGMFQCGEHQIECLDRLLSLGCVHPVEKALDDGVVLERVYRAPLAHRIRIAPPATAVARLTIDSTSITMDSTLLQ